METEIRTCFSLFVNHMRGTIKHLPEYDYDKLTIQQIRAEMEVIFMKYILSSSYSISETSVGFVSYRHLKKMIDSDETKIKYYKIESELKMLSLENTILKQELSELKNKISSTLFPLKPLSLDSTYQSVDSIPQTTQKGWFS